MDRDDVNAILGIFVGVMVALIFVLILNASMP